MKKVYVDHTNKKVYTEDQYAKYREKMIDHDHTNALAKIVRVSEVFNTLITTVNGMKSVGTTITLDSTNTEINEAMRVYAAYLKYLPRNVQVTCTQQSTKVIVNHESADAFVASLREALLNFQKWVNELPNSTSYDLEEYILVEEDDAK